MSDTRRDLRLSLHFFLCSPGWVVVLFILSRPLARALFSAPLSGFNEWASPFYYVAKPPMMVAYVLVILGLLAYYSALFALERKGSGGAFFDWLGESPARRWAYFAAIFGGDLLALLSRSPLSGSWSFAACAAGLLIWANALLSPLYFEAWRRRERLREQVGMPQPSFEAALAGLLFIQFLLSLWPFLNGRPQMINEYLDIPEQTRMASGYVDNAAYINQHDIGGLRKYHPDVDRGNAPAPRPGTYIPFPKSEALGEFLRDREDSFYYDDARGILVARNMTPMERYELHALTKEPAQRGWVDRLFYSIQSISGERKNPSFTSEQKDFLEKNAFELHWQILNRWVIHHHNFVLGPISAWALGRPLKELSVQYGIGNLLLTKFLMERIGAIDYPSYFRVWYSYWPLYFALALAGVWFLFGQASYVILFALLSFGSIQFLDFEFLFLGPGLNPIRHFFDIPIAVALFLYAKGGKARWLGAALLLSLLAVFNNVQFGLFAFGAAAVALGVSALERGRAERNKGLLAIFAGGLAVAALMAALKGMFGDDYMSQYYFKGFASFPMTQKEFFAIVAVVSTCYFALLTHWGERDPFKFVALYFVLYAQFIMFYYVWGKTNAHALKLVPVIALAALALLKQVLSARAPRYETLMLRSLALAALLCLYVPSLYVYGSSRLRYERIFSDHKVYSWSLPRARFKSTMDPRYFEDSVGLIRKYSEGEQGIFILSKYDSFLTFLAERYSRMPFLDVSWFLLTHRETRRCVDSIREARPEHLFVDTDIDRSFNGEIIENSLPVRSGGRLESVLRVQRLGELKKLFNAVREEYAPVERGSLITVYRRLATVKRNMPNGRRPEVLRTKGKRRSMSAI